MDGESVTEAHRIAVGVLQTEPSGADVWSDADMRAVSQGLVDLARDVNAAYWNKIRAENAALRQQRDDLKRCLDRTQRPAGDFAKHVVAIEVAYERVRAERDELAARGSICDTSS
jgi:hypothetical protein